MAYFMNVYRDDKGELTYSSDEFGKSQDSIATIEAVKNDVWLWLVHASGDYVATLSDDGVNHTPEIEKFATRIGNLIDLAESLSVRPSEHTPMTILSAIESARENTRAVRCEHHDETFYESI